MKTSILSVSLLTTALLTTSQVYANCHDLVVHVNNESSKKLSIMAKPSKQDDVITKGLQPGEVFNYKIEGGHGIDDKVSMFIDVSKAIEGGANESLRNVTVFNQHGAVDESTPEYFNDAEKKFQFMVDRVSLSCDVDKDKPGSYTLTIQDK